MDIEHNTECESPYVNYRYRVRLSDVLDLQLGYDIKSKSLSCLRARAILFDELDY